MALIKNTPPKSDDTSWLISYSDVVTSLMAFFLLIVSMSTIDQKKVEYMQESIQEGLLKQDYAKPFTTLEKSIQGIIQEQELQKDVFIEADNTGIIINFSSSVLYTSGSADLQKKIIPFLVDISTKIKDMQYKNILIEVEGHTDDVPIRTKVFPSNWELSTARASRVVRFLASQGIPKKSLKASGYADSRPKVPNYVKLKPNSKNRAVNRRIKVIVSRDDSYNMPVSDG